MIKKTIVETIYEYDKEGKVTRKIVTETTEEDTNTYWPNIPQPYIGDPIYCSDSTSTAKTLVNDRVYADNGSTDHASAQANKDAAVNTTLS